CRGRRYDRTAPRRAPACAGPQHAREGTRADQDRAHEARRRANPASGGRPTGLAASPTTREEGVIGALTRDAAAPAAQRWPPSLFRHVGDQITRLMPLLGVERSTPQIREAFAILCRESLAPPEDDQVPRVSRLNADGTPFQFGLTL